MKPDDDLTLVLRALGAFRTYYETPPILVPRHLLEWAKRLGVDVTDYAPSRAMNGHQLRRKVKEPAKRRRGRPKGCKDTKPRRKRRWFRKPVEMEEANECG